MDQAAQAFQTVVGSMSVVEYILNITQGAYDMHSFRKDHTRDLRELRSALETALRVMEEHRCNQPWIFERTEALEALLLATHDATIKLGVDHFSQYCYVRQGLQRQNLDAACEYIQRVSEAVTSRLQTISTTSSLRKIFWTLFERKEFRKIVQTVRTSAENIAVFVARPQTNTTCDHEEFETDFGGVLPLCLGCTRLLYGAGGLPRGLLSPKYRLIQAKARHSGQQACVVEDSESSCSVSLPVSNRKWEQIDNYTSSPHHVDMCSSRDHEISRTLIFVCGIMAFSLIVTNLLRKWA